MTTLPDTHLSALAWLSEHGGAGVIDQYGRVIAQGERYKSGETAQVWLRLFCSEHIMTAGPSRLKLTLAGEVEAHAVLNKRGRDGFSFSQDSNRRPLMIDDDPNEFA